MTYFKNIFSQLKSCIFAHIQACIGPFDTILNVPIEVKIQNVNQLIVFGKTRPLSANRKFYLFPFMLYMIYWADTGWILYKHDFNYPVDPMPEMLGHKMFPRMFWLNSDVILNTAMVVIAGQYFTLWRKDWIDQRYCMFLVTMRQNRQVLFVNHKVWDKTNSAKLIAIHKRSKATILYTVTYMLAAFYFNFQYLNREWDDGWKDWATYFVYYNPMLWYNVNAMVILFFHFYMNTEYILVKQKFLISKLRKLVLTLQTLPRKRKKARFARLQHQFRSINADLSYQCAEIRAHSHFWSVHLTAQSIFYTVIICYSLYCHMFVFEEWTNWQGWLYFTVFPIELGTMMFAMILKCSMVDANNDRCYELNMQVCRWMQFKFGKQIPPKILANIETITNNRNITRCCFYLLNDYRLDANAFQLAIYVTSTLFIMLVKKKLNEILQNSTAGMRKEWTSVNWWTFENSF